MLIALGVGAFAEDWNYDADTLDWSATYELCAGEEQSPINLDEGTSVLADFAVAVEQLEFSAGLVENSGGHTYEFVPEEEGLVSATNPLTGEEYLLAQLHFHWDEGNSTAGSEHRRSNVAFPLELHLVMYNSKFESSTAAVESAERDALMVIGQWFQIGAANPVLELLTAHAAEITAADAEFELEDHVDVLGLVTLNGDAWTYSGSLTTPTCDQVVQWVVMESRMTVSQAQLDAIYSIERETGERIERNWRPVQDLNDREVLRNFATTVPRPRAVRSRQTTRGGRR